jgi:hypothetical protein
VFLYARERGGAQKRAHFTFGAWGPKRGQPAFGIYTIIKRLHEMQEIVKIRKDFTQIYEVSLSKCESKLSYQSLTGIYHSRSEIKSTYMPPPRSSMSVTPASNYINPPRYSLSRRCIIWRWRVPECTLCGTARSRKHRKSKVPEPLVCSRCIKHANEKLESSKTVLVHHHHYYNMPAVGNNGTENGAIELESVRERDRQECKVEMPGNTALVDGLQRYSRPLSPISEMPPEVSYDTKPSLVRDV